MDAVHAGAPAGAPFFDLDAKNEELEFKQDPLPSRSSDGSLRELLSAAEQYNGHCTCMVLELRRDQCT